MNNGKGKYIRVNDGIYELCWVSNDSWYSTKGSGMFHCDEVLKQSDKIEDLCNGFRFIYEDYNDTPVVIDQERLDQLKELEQFGGHIKSNLKYKIVYGVIWIKLKCGAYRIEPVAVLNNKGEMELLSYKDKKEE